VPKGELVDAAPAVRIKAGGKDRAFPGKLPRGGTGVLRLAFLPMPLQANVAANYASQIYVAVVGIVFVPVYMRLLGAESYGLVAFFTLLQAWFQLFDMGFTATISRETARYLSGSTDARHLRQLLRSLEAIFWSVGLLVAMVLTLLAPQVATKWLSVEALPSKVVVTSLSVMAFAISLRWISGLYRGAIAGLERQVWLSMFSVAVVSLRFIAVIPVLTHVGRGAIVFFLWQLIVSCVELAVLALFTYSRVRLPKGTHVGWSWVPLRSVFGFSATVAVTSAAGVLIGQVDKLVLSKLMPLEQYGYFTAAVLVASAISLAAAPVSIALMPRLTQLAERNDSEGLFLLYRQATQGVVAVTGAGAVVLAMLGKQVLWVWTGNAEFASHYFMVLALYAVGNAFLAVAGFPYYLQFARGDMRMHLWGNLGFLVVLVPVIVVVTLHFGAIGAGIVWTTINALFFIAWVPFVHRRFLPGRHGAWLTHDVLKALIVPVAAVPLLMLVPQNLHGRWLTGGGIALAAVCLAGLALICCDLIRPKILRVLVSHATGLR
jgi:O-antigen/teichoic acid export membrane protein